MFFHAVAKLGCAFLGFRSQECCSQGKNDKDRGSQSQIVLQDAVEFLSKQR